MKRFFLIILSLMTLLPVDGFTDDVKEEIGVELVSWEIQGDYFMPPMIADLKIINRSEHDVKDVRIRCLGYGKSKTLLSINEVVIYDVFPKNTTKTVGKFDMGSIDSQVATEECECVGYSGD